jgi:hypothetical protein
MPRKRRTAKARRTELTYDQENELLYGPPGAALSDFESPFLRRAAWYEHREDLMADPTPGMRPWGWWAYEGGGQRPEDEAAELRRMGKLEPWEEAQLEAMNDVGRHGERSSGSLMDEP